MSNVMARYRIQFLSRSHPTSVDGLAAGLRVLRDDDYFQFFLPIVPGIDLVTIGGEVDEEWWSALVAVGAQEVERMITDGQTQPLADPTEGILVPVSAHQVAAYRTSGAALPHLDDGQWGGIEVAAFNA